MRFLGKVYGEDGKRGDLRYVIEVSVEEFEQIQTHKQVEEELNPINAGHK